MASRTSTDPIEILLELGIDLDNISSEKDYLNALKEGIATITFLTKGKGDARLRILSQEVIKVRSKRKAADAKFKAKRTTVSASSFKKGTATAGRQKALPPSRPTTSLVEYQKPQRQAKEKPDKATKAVATTAAKQQSLLVGIAKSVDNIAKILKKQYNLKKKSTSYDRKQAERDRRKVQESNLEKGFKGLKKVAEKVVAPVKGILGELLDFFVNILIGRFLYKLFDWFGKPENQKKLDSVIRFFTDFAPALISGFLLFGTSIGRFVTRLTFTLVKGASKLIGLLPGWAKVGALLFGAGAIIPQMFPGTVKDDADKQADELANRVGKDKAAENIRNQQGGFFDFLTGAGQEREEQSQRLETGQEKKYGFFGEVKRFGGAIRSSNKITGNSGTDVTGAGVDTQLIAAQPGEVVINKKTVDAVGADYFLGLNRKYGGANANKPKLARVQTASGGGFVLPAFRDGGPIGGGPTFAEHANDFKERYISGDKSLLNQLALGNTKGALEALGIKIDNNTEAVDRNTDQRKKDGEDFQQGLQRFITNRKKELESAGPAITGFLADRQKDLESAGPAITAGATEFAQKINPLPGIGRALSSIAEKPYIGEEGIDKLTKERIASGELGPDGKGLTKTTQKNLDAHDAYIRGLYNPDKDTGFMGFLKKMNQDIQNRGLIADPLAQLGLKEEGTEKFIEKITGGRVKNFGAKLTGVQMAAKGLAGPLGRMFRIDDRGSLGRYLRPAMEYAISQGHTSVGAESFGQAKYDELVGDKMANLALGQINFEIDEKGRAKTRDVFDSSNKTPKQYLEDSRKNLKLSGDILQGKVEGDLAKALYQTAFQGGSGRLAIAQNTGFGNLRPMGLDIDLGGGFTPKKKELSEKEKQSAKALLMGGKDAYYSSTTKRYYQNYAEALKDPKVAAAANLEGIKKQFSLASTQPSGVSSPPPPPPSLGSNITVVPRSSTPSQTPGSSNNGSKTNAVNPGAGDQGNWNIFGIPVPKLF